MQCSVLQQHMRCNWYCMGRPTWNTSPLTSGMSSSSQTLARCPGFKILTAPCRFQRTCNLIAD